uniref:Uncharacterized protein n=1 Tax=Ananas comosus var. bracteatus TaxID=296719 RepID=A0A6V7PLY5_ANACO|nr:unnamed protein product [Ananas comosus var. bracteatus]
MSHPEGDTSGDVVAGISSLYDTCARTLFDTRVSHSFILCSFACDHGFASSPLSASLRIQIPGVDLEADRCIMSCPILLGNWAFLVNLVLLPLKEFDVVLGMDWLPKHHISIDCERRLVTFALPGEEKFVYRACKSFIFSMSISSARARRLMISGCTAYLASWTSSTERHRR